MKNVVSKKRFKVVFRYFIPLVIIVAMQTFYPWKLQSFNLNFYINTLQTSHSVGEASVNTIESGSDGHPVLRACVITCLDTIHVLEHRAAVIRGDVHCWQCKRWFRGTRGLRIHSSKTACGRAIESEVNDRGSASEQSGNPMSTVVPEPVVQTLESVPDHSSESYDNINIQQYSTEDEIAKLQRAEE